VKNTGTRITDLRPTQFVYDSYIKWAMDASLSGLMKISSLNVSRRVVSIS
jgi:hypothetical protein